MSSNLKFSHRTFGTRLRSMLAVDFRRMFTSGTFYVITGICLIIPILILVMITMMEGTVTVDPQTGAESVVQGFSSAWDIIGTTGGSDSAMSMDMTAMCNINLLYFAVAVLVGLFVSEDFKSGYAKNLFTVRAKRGEYVASKTIVCCMAGAVMMAAFFAGTMLGGVFAGLSFDLGGLAAGNVVFCMLAKTFLIAVFVPIFLLMSVLAKQKTWLAILGGCAVGMLLFMMVPMITPLSSTVMNAGMCLAGGIIFSLGVGAVNTKLIQHRDMV